MTLNRPTVWLSLLLMVSLAVNLVMAGWVMGMRRHPAFQEMNDEGRPPFARGLTENKNRKGVNLPPQAKELLENHRPRMKEKWRAMREQRKVIESLLAAETIDKPALEAALQELAERNRALQQEGHSLLLEMAETLPPEERKALIRHFSRYKPGKAMHEEREDAPRQ
jgi:uncharacterized membrane protein